MVGGIHAWGCVCVAGALCMGVCARMGAYVGGIHVWGMHVWGHACVGAWGYTCRGVCGEGACMTKGTKGEEACGTPPFGMLCC